MSDAPALEVLDALADGALHSGEALAQQFGISRAALAKRVEKLRDWGLEVPAQAGAGYQLAQPLERLDAARIAAGLSPAAQALGVRVQVLARTDSTNSQLLEASAAHDPQLLFAEYQSAGRGRRGRAWVSPFGGSLMLSLSYNFASWPARLTTLPLAVAVAAARAVSAMGLPQVRIKWPNDLKLGGDKLAGILIEPRGETGGACRVVVGLGLNWNLSGEQLQGLGQPATTVQRALAGQPLPSRNAAASLLASELLLALQAFEQHGFEPFAPEWRLRDALAGQPVRVEADPPFEGVAQGINVDGGLLVATAQGIQSVHAGEVSVRARA